MYGKKESDRRTVRRTVTAVINSSLYGVVSEGIRQEEIGHVYGMVNGIEGFLKGTVLDFEEALPGEKLEYLTYTPGAYLGSCRYKLPQSLKNRYTRNCSAGLKR